MSKRIPTVVTTVWDGTWSNGVPNSQKNVQLKTPYNTGTSGSFICRNLEIPASSSLIIAANTYVQVHGDTITQSSSGTTFTVNKYGEFRVLHPSPNVSSLRMTINGAIPNMKRLDYWLVGFPMTGGRTFNSIVPNSAAQYQYGATTDGGSSTYTLLLNSNTPKAGAGILMRAPNSWSLGVIQDMDMTVDNLSNGAILNVGEIMVKQVGGDYWYNSSPSGVVHYGSQTLAFVCNPYAASISIKKFLEKNRKLLDKGSYIFTYERTDSSPQSNYQTVGHLLTTGSDKSMKGKIPPFWGFWIRFDANISVSERNVIFTPEMQIIESVAHDSYFSLAYFSNAVSKPLQRVTADFNYYNPRKWLDIQQPFPGLYIGNSLTSSATQFALMNNTYVINPPVIENGYFPASIFADADVNQLYDGKTFDIFHKTPTLNDFTITLTGFSGKLNNYDIYLQDNVLNTVTNLKTAGSYTFPALTAGGYNSTRFKIKLVLVT